MYEALWRLTYDIIGIIAIDHAFHAVKDPKGQGGVLFAKYQAMQELVPGNQGVRQEISSLFPIFDKIWVSLPPLHVKSNVKGADQTLVPSLANGKLQADRCCHAASRGAGGRQSGVEEEGARREKG